MAYDTTNPNWEGTGSTEEEWRKRYPIPGQTPLPTDPYATQPGMATGGGYESGTTPYGDDTRVNVLPSPTAPAPMPRPTVPAAPAAPREWTPQEAAAAGLGWVDSNHPLYGTPGFVGNTAGGAPGAAGTPGGAGYVPPNLAPGTPGPTTLDTQNENAQTYSQTPGAAPANNTTNQGTQDVVRNTYLQQLQKGTAVDTNDPNFRMQADAYSAAQERQRRNAQDDAGEAAFAQGARGSGAVNLAKMYADEQAGQNVGAFEADLVGRELTNRRDEIRNALSSLGGMIDSDQKLALNRELAALDAALKRESLAQTGRLGESDIGLRRELGTGALNVDMIRALLQNQQFGNQLGTNIGQSEMDFYLRSMGL